MNLNAHPTVEQLRELLQDCDDLAGNHILWVKKSGEVAISVVADGEPATDFQAAHPEMQLRFETFQAGNEYVGAEAADDHEWVSELFQKLISQWAGAKGKQEVAYAGQF